MVAPKKLWQTLKNFDYPKKLSVVKRVANALSNPQTIDFTLFFRRPLHRHCGKCISTHLIITLKVDFVNMLFNAQALILLGFSYQSTFPIDTNTFLIRACFGRYLYRIWRQNGVILRHFFGVKSSYYTSIFT